MSLWRTLVWRSRRPRMDAMGFWQPPGTLDDADPEIRNLPLLDPPVVPPVTDVPKLALLGVGL